MSAPARLVILTPAQRAVLGHLTHDGADDATIALRMGLSINTVKAHMKGIFAAFDRTNRTAVVVDCLRGQVRVRAEDNRGATSTGPCPRCGAPRGGRLIRGHGEQCQP